MNEIVVLAPVIAHFCREQLKRVLVTECGLIIGSFKYSFATTQFYLIIPCLFVHPAPSIHWTSVFNIPIIFSIFLAMYRLYAGTTDQLGDAVLTCTAG